MCQKTIKQPGLYNLRHISHYSSHTYIIYTITLGCKSLRVITTELRKAHRIAISKVFHGDESRRSITSITLLLPLPLVTQATERERVASLFCSSIFSFLSSGKKKKYQLPKIWSVAHFMLHLHSNNLLRRGESLFFLSDSVYIYIVRCIFIRPSFY